ncbi:AAA+-type ATPase [Puccinia graminis f. sp. tritici]|uniref:AAA+-type ATPase n=1 Tax=Puccinia graminis f. sp. tritici TaxID=56615 RepID=A0A5B0RF04_PUCGR|nr:AAA+-type ATPase [Puccinia graminis f. sp. tritici]KAA1123495.1 AAA+-type ATPase [Puccinia graminis f. sp. tritici]
MMDHSVYLLDHSPVDHHHHRFFKRVLLSQQHIKNSKLTTNQSILIRPLLHQLTINNDGQQQHRFAIGTVWPSSSSNNNQDSKEEAVGISLDTMINIGIKPGELITITPLPPILPPNHIGPGRGIRLPEAKLIKLKQTKPPNEYQELIPTTITISTTATTTTQSSDRLWEGFIREVLVDRKYLAINHYIIIPYANQLRFYHIQDIQSTTTTTTTTTTTNPSDSLELFFITRNTRLEIIKPSTPSKPSTTTTTTTQSLLTQSADQIGYEAIGGLQSQIEQIREMVELPLTRPELYSHFGIKPPKGILLYGPPGTGKTHLASIIAKSTNSTLLTLSTATISSAYHGEGEQKIFEIFAEAKEKSPSMIMIDEIDGLFPSREIGSEVDRRMVGALLTCMDGMEEKNDDTGLDQEERPRVIVIATTNRPQTLDPALRRPGRFDRELEIGIPNGGARLEILQVLLRKTPHRLTAAEIKEVADKTHGFVGADLLALVREAGLGAIKRSLATHIALQDMHLQPQDLSQALLKIRPSAMRELLVETPTTRWTDIGGQTAIKQRLLETLKWPAEHPQTFKRLGISPVRGILLYGPPGCSKTLIAKALATESGLNFIAIKGSDVFNKYLGESEKSIRDLFKKARANSPSIIFIDEIDSIAMARAGSDDLAGGGGTGVGDRVLTSLLVEMDGIEELNGVLVLAATNRPEVIDPALMRPGRLDRILYVGPPDLDSRIEIFKINFKKMSVDPSLDIHKLAALTDGSTGAEIVAICQDAAINAIHRDFNVAFIMEEDFLKSIQKIVKKQAINSQLIQHYENWRDLVGVQSA